MNGMNNFSAKIKSLCIPRIKIALKGPDIIEEVNVLPSMTDIN